MAGNKKKSVTKTRVLADHKKVGQVLVPPMREYLGERGTVSWADRILPELIWQAVIIEYAGVERGVELCAIIAKSANVVLTQEYFAFASSFDFLGIAGKQQVVCSLEDQGCLREVRGSLKTFLQLYPECPLKFLDNSPRQSVDTKNVVAFKGTLAKYFNRHAQPAMIIQANVVYFAGICGKLKYMTGVSVPKLEAIVSDFESSESKHACASVRATVNGFMGHIGEKISDRWPRYFWNRGAELDPVRPIVRQQAQSPLKLPEQLGRFVELAELGLAERWSRLPKDIYDIHQCEVVGALLARQVTLAKRMARNPDFCDMHIGPIFLRVMVDNHITLAWILKDLPTRARLFVLHGLGQAKLYVEHLKAAKEDNADVRLQPAIEAMERWIDSQQYSFLTEVNLGSWSGADARQMAEQADCLDVYRYAYTPFSSCVHNMWNHVGRLNLAQSGNALHKYLLVPGDPELEPEFDMLLNCAKYLQESFSAVDKAFNLQCQTQLPFDYWLTQGNEQKDGISDNGETSGSGSR